MCVLMESLGNAFQKAVVDIVYHFLQISGLLEYMELSVGAGAFFQNLMYVINGVFAAQMRDYIVYKIQ